MNQINQICSAVSLAWLQVWNIKNGDECDNWLRSNTRSWIIMKFGSIFRNTIFIFNTTYALWWLWFSFIYGIRNKLLKLSYHVEKVTNIENQSSKLKPKNINHINILPKCTYMVVWGKWDPEYFNFSLPITMHKWFVEE